MSHMNSTFLWQNLKIYPALYSIFFFQTIILLVFFFIQRLFRMGQSFELIVWIRCTWCAKAAKLADKSKWVPRTANERLRARCISKKLDEMSVGIIRHYAWAKIQIQITFFTISFLITHPNLFVTVTASLGWLHCNYNKRRRSIRRTTRMRVSR